ncbi:MAG: DUF3568 family protein [Thioalkalispiraceae bacterium]|jgi:hypothetical protein
MRNILLLVSFIAVVATGCASTETVKLAQGQGTKRVYAYSFDTVYKASLSAAAKHKLDIVESNKETKKIILSHGTTWLSWGEKIAIFFIPQTNTSTEVEIVSKPVMSPLNFPPEWEKILLDQIGEELHMNN